MRWPGPLAQPHAGRVPAGNNGIVGIKPSVGRFSTTGVVPACYLLDCVSVFSLSVEDGAEVARLMENGDVAGALQQGSVWCCAPAVWEDSVRVCFGAGGGLKGAQQLARACRGAGALPVPGFRRLGLAGMNINP